MAGDRGHLRIFIGMAPGVGKTYRMLREGKAEAAAGRDVAIGYLESHGRAETVEQAQGLEAIPTRSVSYRGTTLEEMDLPAVLARKPGLCLIDELAHTNASGVEHDKRYEDVNAVLAAGIDVWSNVNVQHLESLNDQITQLTGTHVRETIPDEVLSQAEEIVLVDISPEALLARLRAGKVYPRERVQAALDGFFKLENLEALRETALRHLADEVELRRLIRAPIAVRRDADALDGRASDGRQAIAERVLALVELNDDAERIVRHAWRSARRLDADLDVLVVRPPGRPASPEDRERLEALRRLVAMLRTRLRVEEGEDLAAIAIDVARALGVTYVLIGTPPARSAFPRLSRRAGESAGGPPDLALLSRLLRGLPGVDIRIVADPTLRDSDAAGPEPRQPAPPARRADSDAKAARAGAHS